MSESLGKHRAQLCGVSSSNMATKANHVHIRQCLQFHQMHLEKHSMSVCELKIEPGVFLI